MFQTDLVRVRLLQRLWWATVTADRPYTAPNPQLWTLWKSQKPKSKWGLWCGWMVPVVIVCIRAYHHWTPHHRHRHLACITKVVKGWSTSFFCMLFHPLKILNFVWSQNWSFPLLFFFSSLLLSTARLSLIRMMDGAELWLQPSPAASWELRDTEWEVEGTVLGRESGSSEGGGGEWVAWLCPVLSIW